MAGEIISESRATSVGISTQMRRNRTCREHDRIATLAFLNRSSLPG
jgi:hypothetical protein